MTKSSKRANKSKVEKLFDVMILGGGPAGMTALLWASQLGLKSVLIEGTNRLGGQLHSIYNPISNYPGRTTKNGKEMSEHFLRSLKDVENSCRLGARITNFDATTITAKLDNGRIISARAAIIATGVRRRKLGIHGETEFIGRGILESGAKERKEIAGMRVAIIGGGDAALENALELAEFAKKVYVIHRRDRLAAREEFIKPARRNKKIEFLFEARVSAIEGNKKVGSVTITRNTSQDRKNLPVDAVLIRIGVEPNSDFVHGQLELDDSGYILVTSQCETSRANILAVGDVANPISPTISTAAGMGATAVKALFSLLNGSGSR